MNTTLVRPQDVASALNTLMEARRQALLVELRAIEDYLGVTPKDRVICPQCLKARNMARKAG